MMKIEQTILAKAVNSSNRKARPTVVWTRQLAMQRTAKCNPVCVRTRLDCAHPLAHSASMRWARRPRPTCKALRPSALLRHAADDDDDEEDGDVGAWQEEQEDLMLAETDDEALEAALRVEAVRVRPQSTRLTCGASF